MGCAGRPAPQPTHFLAANVLLTFRNSAMWGASLMTKHRRNPDFVNDSLFLSCYSSQGVVDCVSTAPVQLFRPLKIRFIEPVSFIWHWRPFRGLWSPSSYEKTGPLYNYPCTYNRAIPDKVPRLFYLGGIKYTIPRSLCGSY